MVLVSLKVFSSSISLQKVFSGFWAKRTKRSKPVSGQIRSIKCMASVEGLTFPVGSKKKQEENEDVSKGESHTCHQVRGRCQETPGISQKPRERCQIILLLCFTKKTTLYLFRLGKSPRLIQETWSPINTPSDVLEEVRLSTELGLFAASSLLHHLHRSKHILSQFLRCLRSIASRETNLFKISKMSILNPITSLFMFMISLSLYYYLFLFDQLLCYRGKLHGRA